MATVKVSQGILRGGKSKTEHGFYYYEFMGVPYAKPPVGELRFKSPQTPEPWINERDATKSDRNNISIQADITTRGKITIGSEDCLYLNVYTPQLPTPDSALLPVIVYIHGGGFVVGNGITKSELGPDYFIEQNAIVVTINYRLGVLGFLSLDIPEAAGNMGLKDQVKALEWVKDNIEYFGGDRKNVTIMGVSAGSASVEYLILSPTAKGLFHKAIMQSGSALNHWALNLKPLDFSRELVRVLDYKGSLNDTKAMHDFMLNIPASTLTLAASQVTAKYGKKKLCCGFVPTLEKDYENKDAFLTSLPYILLHEGKFNKVPVIRGFCNREGSLTSTFNPDAKKNLTELKEFVDPYPYGIEFADKDLYNSKCLSAYLSDRGDDLETIAEDFFGDLDFVSGVWVSGKFLSKYVPVYMYRFEHGGKINSFKKMFGVNLDEPGAMHGDDITYSLKNDAIEGADEVDVLVRKRVVTIFTNFLKFGKPVPDTADVLVNWPLFTAEKKMYLGINKDLHLRSDYEPKKIAIFEELYKKFLRTMMQSMEHAN